MIVSLRKNNEFQRVYKKGTYKAGRYLVMYVLPNKELESPRERNLETVCRETA